MLRAGRRGRGVDREFGYAGSGENWSAFPKARVVALSECGTHAFVAAEIGSYATGEKTLAATLYPRLRADELLTADRGFYSWAAWDAAQATGAALVWRAPTQLDLPVVTVLPDGTYWTVLIKATIRGGRRERLLAAARAGKDLEDINAVPDAFDERGQPVAHLARVVEYDVPDREGNGTGELIVLLTTVMDLPSSGADPAGARADELASVYHERWEQETGHDQLKTHLRGPGRVLRSRLPDLVHQEIWAYLIVHHAISALIAKASAAADRDPDRVSFANVLRLIRRTATGTADTPPQDWADALDKHLGQIATLLIPTRRHRESPRAVKRARHSRRCAPPELPRQEPHEPASTRHNGPPTIRLHTRTPPGSMINLRYVALRLGQPEPMPGLSRWWCFIRWTPSL